jgi:hypothetical protein
MSMSSFYAFLEVSMKMRSLFGEWIVESALAVIMLASWAIVSPRTALAVPQEDPEYRAEFLKLCDQACEELNKEVTPWIDWSDESPKTHHVPWFEDSYCVRALCVAYDVTGKKEYLDTCTRWADMVVDRQQGMIPKGAYYINYFGARAPGQDSGPWYAADSGSIAMGVLAIAARTQDAQKRQRYLDSIRSFARLVIDNYVGKGGGITDGIYTYTGEYWCSTYTFGAFLFLAYAETKDPEYLKIGLGAVDWVNKFDFSKDQKPEFAAFYPCMVFYGYEFYAAALPYLEANSPRRQAAEAHIAEGFKWLAENQQGRGAKSKWDYLKEDDYMFGNPYFMYILARGLPQHQDQVAGADLELRYLRSLLFRDGKLRLSNVYVWEMTTFMMMSYAEKVSPGSLFRTSKP